MTRLGSYELNTIITGDARELHLGDCLEVMATLPADSVDSCITDPPYGLSDGVAYGLDNRIMGALGNIVFPNLDKRDTQTIEDGDFGRVPVSSSPLCQGEVINIVESWIGVPKSSVYLNGDIMGGQVEVNGGHTTAGNGGTNTELGDSLNTEGDEFLGDYTLDTGDSWELAVGDGSSGLVSELFYGGFSVPVAPVLNSCSPSPLARLASVILCRDVVGLPDDALGQAAGTADVVTLGRAINAFMLRFDLRGGAVELRATYRTSQNNPGSFLSVPKLVRANTAASGLAAEYEPVRVRLVGLSANGTDLFCFHLWLRRDWVKKLNGIIPRGGFMGKDWDATTPEVEIWRAVYRVLKPGGFVLAFGGTRSWHRLAVSLEEAGFEIRDTIFWVHAQGFPKSHDISKGIDKAAGVEREIIETRPHRSAFNCSGTHQAFAGETHSREVSFTTPATDLARQWDGYGTALKPAVEPIVVAMKPIASTFAANAEKWGVAGLWIDGGRIETNGENIPHFDTSGGRRKFAERGERHANNHKVETLGYRPPSIGRWPANLILDEHTAVMLDEQSGDRPSGSGNKSPRNHYDGTFKGIGASPNPSVGGDSGGASRFFYVAKASKGERGEGNDHPTVKPLMLMRYLCRLTRPPSGGVVLDPFMGSGTTGIAAVMEGRGFIGIEKHLPYFEIAKSRIGKAQPEPVQEALPL